MSFVESDLNWSFCYGADSLCPDTIRGISLSLTVLVKANDNCKGRVVINICRAGGFIMRRFGTLGLLTGTQVFSPSQFREKVSGQIRAERETKTWRVSKSDFKLSISSDCLVLGARRDHSRGSQPDRPLPRSQVQHLGGQDHRGGGSLGHHRLHWRVQW